MTENLLLRIWYKIVDINGDIFKNTSISSCLLPLSGSNSLVVDDFKKQIHREQSPLLGKKLKDQVFGLKGNLVNYGSSKLSQ